MRQNRSCFIGKEERSKMRQKYVKIASKMRGTPLGENTFWTTPRNIFCFELIRRGVIYYTVMFHPELLELIMRGNSAACHVEKPRLGASGVNSQSASEPQKGNPLHLPILQCESIERLESKRFWRLGVPRVL